MALLRVEDHDVGVRARRDRALARVEPEELRRVRREQLDHPVQRDPALRTPKWWIMCSRFSRPGPPFGIFEKSSRPSVFCPSQRNAQWSVEIDGEHVGADGVPEHVLVLLRPRRRRVDVLRALEVRPLEEGVVDEEVLRARLAPDVPALLARERDRLDRLAARDVDDVQRAAGDARELDRAVRRLALESRADA